MKKRVLSILLSICLFGGLLTAGSGFLPEAEAKTTAKSTMKYGLSVDENGSFQLNGSTFYGYGINGAAGNFWSDPFDTHYEDTLATCEKYDIPFIRLWIAGGSAEEYAAFENGDDYMFDSGERMLDMAQEAGIGVIVCIFGSQAYTGWLGEHPSSQGEVDSKSFKFMQKWLAAFVNRYKDHPALWGWELRNEGDLDADLGALGFGGTQQQHFGGLVGNDVTGLESLPSDGFQVFYREAAKIIRNLDGSDRMISNGNAMHRNAAYHLHLNSQLRDENYNYPEGWTLDWTLDTLEQFRYMHEYWAPGEVDTISTHMGMPNINNFVYGLADVDMSYEDLLKEYVSMAKKLKKGFYYGEFGDMGILDEDKAEDVLTSTQKNLELMVSTGVQLASLWQRLGVNDYIKDEGKLKLILAEIQKTNKEFKKQGLQKTDEYWAAVAKQEAQNSSSSTSVVSSAMSSTSTSSTPVTTVDVSKFMVTSSKKLTISPSDSSIIIEDAVTYDVFKRSIGLKTGYTMTVVDQDGNAITADDAMVNSGCVVAVFDPDGVKQVTFTVRTTVEDSSTVSALTESQDSTASSDVQADAQGGNGWVLWVIIAAVVVLAAGGFAFYWFYLRKRGK